MNQRIVAIEEFAKLIETTYMYIEITMSRVVWPTCQNRSNPTQPTGLGRFLQLGGLGWVTKFFLIAVRVIKFRT